MSDKTRDPLDDEIAKRRLIALDDINNERPRVEGAQWRQIPERELIDQMLEEDFLKCR